MAGNRLIRGIFINKDKKRSSAFLLSRQALSVAATYPDYVALF